MTRLRRLAAALALALTTVLAAPLAAHAVGYQFWGYYQLVDGEWAFAVEGVGTTVPDDGTVQALRFAVSSGEDVRAPRDVLDFEEVCGDVAAEDGSKRVALVIDPGRDVDAPEGETPLEPGAQCVTAEPDATMLELVRQAVGDVRTDDANMICGLAGFPTTGCGDEVAEPTEEQLAPDEPIEIPVVPVGTPIVAPPTDTQPTEEPTDGQPTEEPTEAETTSPDETTGATATDEATEQTTDEGSAGETTTGATTEEPAESPSETPDEAVDEEPGSGVPPWAWVVGVLVLLGILAFVATSARNRRLDEARREPYDEGLRNRSDDQFPDGPDERFPRDPDGR